MSFSSENFYANVEAKRRQNIEDNRRFLAALKINDICNEIKEITTTNTDEENVNLHRRKGGKKEIQADIVRRSSRIRKNVIQKENLLPFEEQPKTKTKKSTQTQPKVKLQLPDHMLIRYHSAGKKVALYNPKAQFGDDENENILI